MAPVVQSVGVLRLRLVRTARRAMVRPVRQLRGRPPIASRHWPASAPDFVGIGAQRSGTSWWYSLIESHPRVHTLAASTKELHYFDSYWDRSFEEDHVDAYHRLFRRPTGKLGGEWTPRYMFDPWTPALLRRAAPNARLLVMLRDPVARFVSAIAHRAERGRRTDETAVAEAVGRGFYHHQLSRVLTHFPRRQLLVLQFERCRDEPHVMLAETFGFLGLPPLSPPATRLRPANRSRTPGVKIPRLLLEEVRSGYRADVERLASAFPQIDLRLWRNFVDLA